MPRIQGVLLALSLGAFPASAQTAAEEGTGVRLQAEQQVLPNGMKVLVVEDHSAPVVSVQLWVHAGSKNERPGITGISHLFEHMMFKGSRKYGPEEHARVIQGSGGVVNAYTTHDVTVYFEDIASDKLDLALALEAERFQHLAINDKNLTTEREVVKEERRFRTDNVPMGRALEEFLAMAFKAHAYQWPVVGWMSDLDAISVADCRAYFKTHYAPNNAVLVIAGDVDPDYAFKRARKHFGRWKRQAPPPAVITTEPEQTGERRITLRAPVQNPLILGGYHIGGYNHPDMPALDVLARILSAGKSSRLYQKLVYEEQTAMVAQGGVLRMEHPGVFYAVAMVKPGEDPAKVEASFFQEIERLKSEPVSDAELQKAKNQLESEFVFSLKRTSSLANAVGSAEVLGGSWELVNQKLPAWRAVTKDDLMRVARTYLSTNNRTLVTMVPESAPEAPRSTP